MDTLPADRVVPGAWQRLRFNRANHRATVWIDGEKAGETLLLTGIYTVSTVVLQVVVGLALALMLLAVAAAVLVPVPGVRAGNRPARRRRALSCR